MGNTISIDPTGGVEVVLSVTKDNSWSFPLLRVFDQKKAQCSAKLDSVRSIANLTCINIVFVNSIGI